MYQWTAVPRISEHNKTANELRKRYLLFGEEKWSEAGWWGGPLCALVRSPAQKRGLPNFPGQIRTGEGSITWKLLHVNPFKSMLILHNSVFSNHLIRVNANVKTSISYGMEFNF